jgi:hypothetical protein
VNGIGEVAGGEGEVGEPLLVAVEEVGAGRDGEGAAGGGEEEEELAGVVFEDEAVGGQTCDTEGGGGAEGGLIQELFKEGGIYTGRALGAADVRTCVDSQKPACCSESCIWYWNGDWSHTGGFGSFMS